MTNKYESKLSCQNLDECIELIEEYIAQLGLNPTECRMESSEVNVTWSINIGDLYIYILINDCGDDYVIAFNAFLFFISPTNQSDLFQKCLSLNGSMVDCSFALSSDGSTMSLNHIRFALGLDLIELARIIGNIITNSQSYRDELINEFGGTLWTP